ncbi:hypothetical protein DQM68_08560 [Leptospira mayottensis]|uniref:DUF1564 family protein n=1 Tax=Leptospira mayottensis TaxID=1137606 RepID=A0ABN5NVZ8_9LEPT|nr:hypothetical protein DQM68_08560 [Leptospira mayottensis]AXR64594.1 hypothetical protein DQM28_10520 [Leptospira mayottensis]AZQ02838.1 hypothetical protein LEP1GSC190_13130 [Leptospira mayottensis 200901116]
MQRIHTITFTRNTHLLLFNDLFRKVTNTRSQNLKRNLQSFGKSVTSAGVPTDYVSLRKFIAFRTISFVVKLL